MANNNDFKGGSPWGAPPGGGNGSGRGGQRPPNIDEVVEKIQKLINKFLPGGKSSGRKPIIFIGMLIFFLGSIIAATSETMWGLIAGRALQGVGAVASTIMALLSDLTTEQSRTKAMAVIGASIGISFAASLIVGPILANLWGLSGLFWLTAVLSILGS